MRLDVPLKWNTVMRTVMSINTPLPQLLQSPAWKGGSHNSRKELGGQGSVTPLLLLKPGGVTAKTGEQNQEEGCELRTIRV
jgi:hypothetical protein